MNHSGGQVVKKKERDSSSKLSRNGQQQSVSQPVAKQTDSPGGGTKAVRQPTQEEKRLAEILHGNADGETRKKMIEEIRDITGCTIDEVVVALHDCNDDMEKAVTALLERDRNEEEDEWEQAGKKQEKKKKAQTPAAKMNGDGFGHHSFGERVEGGGDREDRKPSERREKRDRSDGAPRPRRDRADRPPRFQRGDAARNGEEQPADDGDDQNESRSRSRRGRGGASSSRGRSAGGRSFRNSGAGRGGFGNWSNDNTDNSQSKLSEEDKPIGSWGETMEDWDAASDNWTGTLTESKVFTASSARADSPKPYSAGDVINGGNSSLFASAQTGGLVGSVFAPSTSLAGDTLPAYQQQQQSSQGQLGQRINLADLMRSSTVGDNSAFTGLQQQYYGNQFSKDAEDTNKNVVGIGGVVGRGLPTQLDQQANTDSAQRAKPKPRSHPPSKIPTTAVVMPGGSSQLNVNCEFGFWDTSSDPAFNGAGMKLQPGSSALSQLQGLDSSSASATSHDLSRTNHYQNASQLDISPRQDSLAYGNAAQGQSAFGQPRTAQSSATVPATTAAKGSSMFSAADFSSYQPSTYKVPSASYSATSSNLSPASYQTGYSSAGVTSTSQATISSYLSGASSQVTSLAQQQSSTVGGSSAYASQSASKLYSGSTMPSYTNDQTLYQSQQQQQLLTNTFGGQGISYDSQPYQGQQSSLGYQSSAAGFSAKQSYTGAANASTSALNLLNASAANAVSDGFSKLDLKDASQSGHDYGARSTAAGSGHTDSVSAATSSALSSAAATASTNRGLASATTSASKVPATGAPTSAVPMVPYNLVGQTGLQGISLMPAVPQMYTDDYALRAAMMPTNYYDMSYQQTPTTLAGRDQNSIATVLPYSVDTKVAGGRVDANSPGSLSTSQQQQLTHQQAYLNPTIPPGYNTVFYPTNNMLAGGYYNQAIFPMPTATNTAAGVHLGGASGAQLPKYYTPSATGYGDVNQQAQVQDYNKMYVVAPQNQTKAGTTGLTSDVTAASYGKIHGQTYDKSAAYQTGTPPPYNLPLGQGGQVVTMAAPSTAYRAQYGVPVMQHSQMVPHMQQDMRGGQQLAGGQMKAAGKYNTTQYWTGN